MREEIGRRIQEHRRARGWSQQRLAMEAGLSISAVAKLERGRSYPSVPTVRALAAAFEVPIQRLLLVQGRRAA